MEILHLYRPHIAVLSNGSELHRLTYCAVENKGAYKSTTHMDRVTCRRCLKKLYTVVRRKNDRRTV